MERVTYITGTTKEVDEAFEGQLAAVRDSGADPLSHRIGGEEVADGPVFEREDPARTDQVASRAHAGNEAIVERAVAAAQSATDAWRHTPYEERCDRLVAATKVIEDRRAEFAAIVSLETGKNRLEALAEVEEGIDLITTYADVVRKNKGWVVPQRSQAGTDHNTSILKPYGVFGVIAPFNFPFALGINMVSGALLAGNSVVLKPSEEAPWSGHLIAEILDASELPAGTFNLVHGDGSVGASLVKSSVDGIAFTGSAPVGRQIARDLQEGPIARPAITELGGKNPAIVAASADIEKAAGGVARAAFGLSGQKCSACSRAIVVDSVYDEFVESLVAQTAGLKVGDPADGDSSLGPVINRASAERFERAAELARKDGQVAVGGDRPDLPGYYVEPTVALDLPQGHELTRDELFLPFVTVTRVPDLDAAIDEANAVVYGLTAGVFTEDAAERERFLDRIEAGVVYVNRGAGATTGAWPGVQSFCGWKSSGSGGGKGGLGPYYVAQFMREQSQTIVD